MTKADRVLVINRLTGIPQRVLNSATAEELDCFVEKHNMGKYMTAEFVQACKVDRAMIKMFG